jgi:hypothetical protein
MLDLAARFEAPAFERRVELTLPDKPSALRYRQQIHGFRDALEHSGQGGQYPNFRSVRMQVKDNLLILTHGDDYLPKPIGV